MRLYQRGALAPLLVSPSTPSGSGSAPSPMPPSESTGIGSSKNSKKSSSSRISSNRWDSPGHVGDRDVANGAIRDGEDLLVKEKRAGEGTAVVERFNACAQLSHGCEALIDGQAEDHDAVETVVDERLVLRDAWGRVGGRRLGDGRFIVGGEVHAVHAAFTAVAFAIEVLVD